MTDRLTARVTADQIAKAFGLSRDRIARARLDLASPAYRPPPGDWEPVLARLARERCKEFKALAEELERR